jgi:nitrogen-specific signal transduction histidine kinase
MADNNEIHLGRKKYTGFQRRFLLVIAGILIVFSGLTASTIYHHEMKNLEENAHEKTQLIMKSIEATREYVQEVLRPTMFKEMGENKFILEAMSSSYISRMIMERFNIKTPGFIYRRVAINARNSDYEANSLEVEMIHRFRNDALLEEWPGIIDVGTKRFFMHFQPVVFKSACLNCHGNPDDAPKDVIDIYGNSKGFFRKPYEIAGVIGVGMPVDFNLDRIKKFAIALFFGVVPSIILIYVIISAFFNRYIASNLRNIISLFRTNIKDGEGKEIFENSQKMDEIDELTATAKAIADRIHNNQSTLEKYADEILTSKDLLQSVFDGITDPVVLMGSEGRIKVVNAAFLNRYHLSMDQVLAQRPSELLKNECCPLALCDDIFHSLPDHPISREVLMKSGEIFLIYFYPIQVATKETKSVVCYVKDITEQRKMETKIQHTEKIASIGQLAAGIAHEINNPLGVILCHIDLIKGDTSLSPETRSDLEIIEKHAGNCRNIISDLLKFAHQHASVKEPYAINAIIEDVLLMVGSQFRQQRIRIETFLDRNIPLVVMDADKIKQVILNILINSAQAIGEDGTITIYCQYDDESRRVKMILEDTGTGIPSDILNKIFDPFFTTKPPGKGTGLGLSVSYGIIRDHNGEIIVESTPGKPTRFIVSLPTEGGYHE